LDGFTAVLMAKDVERGGFACRAPHHGVSVFLISGESQTGDSAAIGELLRDLHRSEFLVYRYRPEVSEGGDIRWVDEFFSEKLRSTCEWRGLAITSPK